MKDNKILQYWNQRCYVKRIPIPSDNNRTYRMNKY